jgi:hypothetical protein
MRVALWVGVLRTKKGKVLPGSVALQVVARNASKGTVHIKWSVVGRVHYEAV